MKKVLGIIVLSLLFSGNAYAYLLKLPVLKCTFSVETFDGNKETTETFDLEQIEKKMIKQDYGKIKVSKDKYKFQFIQKFDTAEVFFKGTINRSTGNFNFTSSEEWSTWFASGKDYKIVGGKTIYRKDVLASVEQEHVGSCDKVERKNL